jgi:DNA-binding IclR family transcriptional regulator
MGTITKALDLLTFFSRERPALGLGDFVRLSGRDKATVHRHLVELAENGFLEQDRDSRAYRLGPAILRLTAVREATAPVRTVVTPLIEAMAQEVGELVHFSLLHGEQLSPVCHLDPGRHGTHVHFDEAEILPLHATASGIAVLAFGDPALREHVFASQLTTYAANTPTDPDALRAFVTEARETGIAQAFRSFDNEVSSRAVPIFGADGTVTGALAVAMPTSRIGEHSEADIQRVLRDGAARVTNSIGGTVPAHYRDTLARNNA